MICGGCAEVADAVEGFNPTDDLINAEFIKSEHRRQCHGPGCTCQHRPQDRRPGIGARS